MTNKDPELLPCQVSDTAIELLARLEEIDGNHAGAFTLRSQGAVGEHFTKKLKAAITAMNTASTIPTDGGATVELNGVKMPERIWLMNYYHCGDVTWESELPDDTDEFEAVEYVRADTAALSIQTISGKGMREALERAIAKFEHWARAFDKHESMQQIADEMRSDADCFRAALANQGERG